MWSSYLRIMSLCFFLPTIMSFSIAFYLSFLSKKFQLVEIIWNHDFITRNIIFSSTIYQIFRWQTFIPCTSNQCLGDILNKTKNKAMENTQETDFQADTHHLSATLPPCKNSNLHLSNLNKLQPAFISLPEQHNIFVGMFLHSVEVMIQQVSISF